MIQFPHALGAGLFALSLMCPQPDAPEAPQAPRPAYLDIECPADRAVLMQQWDPNTLPGNPDGTQILVTTIDDDPSGGAEANCQDAGGQLLYLPATDTFLCLNIDY